MTKQQLLSARDYFEAVTRPAYDRYMAEPSTFLNTYSLVNTLFHLAEWLFHFKKQELQAKYGQTITTGTKLFTEVIEKQVKDAGLIKDLNNISKHVEIHNKPSTTMHHSANTHIVSPGFGAGGFGTGRFGGANVTLKEGGQDILLDDVAKRVFVFWETLLDEIDPLPKAPTVVVSSTTPSANS